MARSRLIRELRRRHVFRVAIAYAVVGWVLIEVGSTIVPALHLPDSLTTAIVVLVLLGFPVALVLAWAYELTPDGVRRTEPAHSPDARPPEQHRQVGRRLDYVIIAVLLVAVMVLAWRQFAPHRQGQAAATPVPAAAPAAPTHAPAGPPVAPARSIAVLPFENLSADEQNEYFVAGMQALILTKLADIGDLKVISRASTVHYGSHPQDLAAIGRQLGVSTLLEGSVQKAGNEVLVNVQLVDAGTSAHIWAESYQRTLDDVFGVEGEVAEKVAAALNAELSPQAATQLATALSHDRTANDLFLRAEYFANRGDIDYDAAQWKQALPLYRKALAGAPGFALARARLSSVESRLAWFGGGGEDVARLIADARAQAAQALELAPGLPEAHIALGYSSYYGRGDYATALKAFAAALALRPNDVGALAAQGLVLRRQGSFDAAIASLQQAQARDPRNTGVAFELGVTSMMASRWFEAETALRHALALDPANVQAKSYLSQTLLQARGDIPAALAAAAGDDPPLRLQRVGLLTYQRRYREALALLDGIPDTPDNFDFNTRPKVLWQADLSRLLGEREKARALYAEALSQARARMPAAGDVAIRQAVVWNFIADAELGLGHAHQASAALARSRALVDEAHDQVNGPAQLELHAAFHGKAGRADLAVPLLERVLAMPGIGNTYSPAMLWLDSAWDPIRRSPAFQALLRKHAADEPVTVPVAPATGDGD
ncbi:MAG TPA: hypothetical protein VM619_16695 [Luteimonas sp.]|nr:hypothetical protein [Luteimonas sp.]